MYIMKNDKLTKTVDQHCTIRYTLNGVPHREDGPAIIYSDGYKSWWLNGILHREDGPAIEKPNGHKEWW